MKRIVICGTDTEVGKTHIGVAMVRALVAAGRKVSVFKPIESGTEATGGPADARALAAAAGTDPDAACPWPLPRPLTPAAELERLGMRVTAADILAAAARVEGGADVSFIETAGGVLSPVTPSLTSADIATLFDASVVLVARSRLGCISHTVSAVEVLRDRGARIEAVVLNEVPGDASDHDVNAEWIARACPEVALVRTRGEVGALLRVLRLS